jgi:hypothetical protein
VHGQRAYQPSSNQENVIEGLLWRARDVDVFVASDSLELVPVIFG